MIRLERDIDLVFKGAKRLRHGGTLAARFVKRERAEAAPPILFLFIIPKRFVRHSHERNQIKRWLREALIHSEVFQTLLSTLRTGNQQYLVSIRVDRPPSTQMHWGVIKPEIELIVEGLKLVVGAN